MTLMTDHRSDTAVRDDVEKELAWTPRIVAAHIGVAADDAAFDASPYVSNSDERIAAARAAWASPSVTEVRNELTIVSR